MRWFLATVALVAVISGCSSVDAATDARLNDLQPVPANVEPGETQPVIHIEKPWLMA